MPKKTNLEQLKSIDFEQNHSMHIINLLKRALPEIIADMEAIEKIDVVVLGQTADDKAMNEIALILDSRQKD